MIKNGVCILVCQGHPYYDWEQLTLEDLKDESGRRCISIFMTNPALLIAEKAPGSMN
ncbi:MAG: hypothetical protein ACRDBO_11035 [Lachnospiraceae bacterium]